MCQAVEEMKKDQQILGFIRGLRCVSISEEEIRNKILSLYNISEKDADLYLFGKVPD